MICYLAISGRLSSLLKGNSRRWFNDFRIANGRQPWSWWKEQIIDKCGSPAWKYKLENKFDESNFDIENDSPVKWFLSQKDRLQALWPNMSLQDQSPIEASSEGIINISEDITTRTKIGQKYRSYRNVKSEKSDNKNNYNPSGNKDSSQEIKPHKEKKCYTCQNIGHTSATCTQKRKNVNQVDAREEISEPDKEDEESVHEFEEESSLSEMSNNIIQVDLDIADVVCDHHLPQEWKGKGYTAGNSNLTTVILNEQEAEMLLDSGGFCSIVPKTYLQKLHQDFRDSLLTAGKVKLNSSSSAMKRVGIFPCFLIIPHPTGGIHCGRGWSQ
ncbi:uncharacterized protein VP01_5618g2 [Puccinia sorghi]|uniref:CCHC-type domain-containing protein n=1 Tax=Puccinia sorghi TaxID=27349 RepID=A0A0L6UIY9_9BASI|nr:uncharacterized protein VP01_5618g2 [Puccinia sorghi]